MINQKIHNYRIIREIGSGGMATVYEAIHTKLDTKVAIKVLDPVLAANESIRQRFMQEAKIMASLNDDGITKVIDFDEEDNHLAIIMEYLEGQTLDEYVAQKGALNEEQAKEIFVPVLKAFEYAHSKGIVHRDVKPSNIFITKEGKVKIMDFGIAKLVEDGAKALTQTGTQMGTPVYMSPEQVNDSKHIDLRTDIYSLGVTLWFLLAGKAPYDTTMDSSYQIFTKIINDPISKLLKYPKLDIVIQTATAKESKSRYNNCQDFLKIISYGRSELEDEKPKLNKHSNEETKVILDNITNQEEQFPKKIISEVIQKPKQIKSIRNLILIVFSTIALVVLGFFLFSHFYKYIVTWSTIIETEGYDIKSATIVQTYDDGFIVSANLEKKDKKDNRREAKEIQVVKLSKDGQVDWDKKYEKGELHYMCKTEGSVIQSIDSGYIIAGYEKKDYFNTNMWLLNLNKSGKERWVKTFGDSYYSSSLRSILQYSDGSYIAVGNVNPRYSGGDSLIILKIDKAGIKDWGKIYSNDYSIGTKLIIQTNNGGFAIIGETSSQETPKISPIVFKLNNQGELEWKRTFPFDKSKHVNLIIQTSDGGYAIGGHEWKGMDSKAFVLKLTNTGDKEWWSFYEADDVVSIIQTEDNGYLLATNDYRSSAIFKISNSGSEEWKKTYAGNVHSLIQTKDGGYSMVGSQIYKENFWVLKLDKNGDLHE